MKHNFEDANVQCPYYNEEGARYINCEGVADDSVLQQIFRNRDCKGAYKSRYCCQSWKSCPFAALLNKKYNYIL